LAQNPVNVTFNGPNGANDLNLFFINLDRNVQPTSGTGSVFNWDAAAGISDNAGAPGGGLLTNATDSTAVYTGAGGTANPTKWYRISLNLQETSPTNFSATAIFDDFGPAGTALVGNLFTGTLTGTVSGFEVANGNTLGADGLAVAAMRQVASPANFDSFVVVVPEPACALALAAAAGTVWTLRRRRQS